jgi:hypothetical protein
LFEKKVQTFVQFLIPRSSFDFNHQTFIKMKDFLLIFRASAAGPSTASPEEMQASMQRWMDWIGGIALKTSWSIVATASLRRGK